MYIQGTARDSYMHNLATEEIYSMFKGSSEMNYDVLSRSDMVVGTKASK
jgi:hypothetical protein